MASNNPYETPQQNVINDSEIVYSDINIFSASGRMGRLSYIAYSFGVMIVFTLAYAIIAGLASLLPESASAIIIGLFSLIAVVALVYISIVIMVQRLHDTNNTGWISLIMLIPFVSMFLTLYLWFAPGTQGANNYGNPPRPSNNAVLIIVLIVAAIFVIGILAAIAIPSYNEYIQKAQEASLQAP